MKISCQSFRCVRHRSWSVLLAVFVVVICVTLSGCGGGSRRLPVEGTVSLDGQPLAKGQINLIPLPPTAGPTAGASIMDGRFSIVPAGGPLAGTFRVEITAVQGTGGKQSAFNVATGQMESVDETRQLVPPRYNTNSELKVEVTTEGHNKFDFALDTK